MREEEVPALELSRVGVCDAFARYQSMFDRVWESAGRAPALV